MESKKLKTSTDEVKKEKQEEIITDAEAQSLEGGVAEKVATKDDDTAPGNGAALRCCN